MSDDKLTWTFTLRDGLEFHDGQPVTSDDVVPSLKRWAVRDSLGQILWTKVAELKALDPKTFQLVLKEPTGIVLQALSKPSGNPFIMPKRVAETPTSEQIKEFVGSGPFIFKRDEWKPGDKTVYVKNPKYKPRAEPAGGLAGGKVAKVDRVEWLAMPDQQTAVNALAAGEIDIIEAPQHDLYPILKKDRNISAGHHQQVGQPVHLPLQPAAQAVRQSQGPAGDALRAEPEGLPRRGDRRSGVLQGLQGDVHVRRAV